MVYIVDFHGSLLSAVSCLFITTTSPIERPFIMTADDTKAATPAENTTGLNGTKTTTTSGPAPSSHPLGPVTKDEISQSSALIRAQWPEGTNFQFKVITLLEPPKAELVPYLDAVKAGQTPTPLDRKTTVIYYLRNTVS